MDMTHEVSRTLNDAAERAIRYLRNIPQRRVNVPSEAVDRLADLSGPLPVRGTAPVRVIELLDRIGSAATVATTGGRFFGFVVGGALPVSVGAHWLADAWDQNACLYDLSPVGAYLEDVVLCWLTDLFGLSLGCGGAFVTGAQMANFTALAAARHAVLDSAGWNVERNGLQGAPGVTIVVSEEVHVTVLKALALLGFGIDSLLKVPTDSQGRMIPHALPKLDGPAIVCTQIGNVNTGSCDPVRAICELAHQTAAWVHVDGAFGMWAAASPSRMQLVQGINAADSWATDAHKWLNVPQDCGIAFVKNADTLRAAMSITSSYLNPSDRREPMQWGPEASRRARAVEVWAALYSLGRDGLAEMIERTCRLAAIFAERLRMAGYEVLNDVTLNQVLVSFGDSSTTNRVIRAIQQDGTCWCGGTVWKGKTAMRISVSSWATTEMDVEASLNAILRIAASA
jgi:glutamate/tyrosine decarboxylase-like PLP-dependent enzyme